MKISSPFSNYILISILLCSLFSTIKAQNNSVIVNIPIEFKTDVPVYNTFLLLYKDRSAFNGIPSGMNMENSLIKYYPLKADTLFVLIGDISENEQICIIDTDLDRDFSNNYKYYFDKRNADLKYTPQPVLFSQNDAGNEGNFRFVSPVFSSSSNITYQEDNEIQQKHQILLGFNGYYKGILQVDNQPYILVIKSFWIGGTNRFDYTIIDSIKFNPKKLGQYTFKKNDDKFIIGKFVVQPLSVSTNKTNIDIQFIHTATIDKDKLFGYDEGFFALNVTKKDMNNNDFNIESYKGKYLLIDFWGTWCNPCIALLPHIVQLNKRYPDLQIVSIAYEIDEKGKNKVPDLIKKHQMHWRNIVETNRESIKATSTYKVSSFPTTILIDPEGKIIHRGGSEKMTELDKKLMQIFLE